MATNWTLLHHSIKDKIRRNPILSDRARHLLFSYIKDEIRRNPCLSDWQAEKLLFET